MANLESVVDSHKMRRRSAVWTFFTVCENDQTRAKCNICEARISRGSGGRMCTTSSLFNHLKFKHPQEFKFTKRNQPTLAIKVNKFLQDALKFQKKLSIIKQINFHSIGIYYLCMNNDRQNLITRIQRPRLLHKSEGWNLRESSKNIITVLFFMNANVSLKQYIFENIIITAIKTFKFSSRLHIFRIAKLKVND